MRPLFGGLAALVGCCFLFGQTPNSTPSCEPSIVKFAAPPYPRAAKDNRIMGTVVSEIGVSADGAVTVRIVRAHPVFDQAVRDALAQWRFKPANQENRLTVTFRFEMDDTCEGTDKHPLTAETRISAELPTDVRIATGTKCLEVESSQEKKRQ